jgi:hypothetical protein
MAGATSARREEVGRLTPSAGRLAVNRADTAATGQHDPSRIGSRDNLDRPTDRGVEFAAPDSDAISGKFECLGLGLPTNFMPRHLAQDLGDVQYITMTISNANLALPAHNLDRGNMFRDGCNCFVPSGRAVLLSVGRETVDLDQWLRPYEILRFCRLRVGCQMESAVAHLGCLLNVDYVKSRFSDFKLVGALRNPIRNIVVSK